MYAVAPCIYSAHCVESVLINYLREIVLNDSWCLRNWLCGMEGVKKFPNHQAERLWIWLNLAISVALLILIPCTYLKWRKELNKASKNFFHHDVSTDNTSIHPLDENYVVVRLWPRSARGFWCERLLGTSTDSLLPLGPTIWLLRGVVGDFRKNILQSDFEREKKWKIYLVEKVPALKKMSIY